jgi:DNA modification methylase
MGGSKDPADLKQDHPTQKPVELMRRSILNHTAAGELVYDAFGGSGSTLIAAEDTGRTCLTMELDPKFADLIILRWQNFTGREATLAGQGNTFEHVKADRRLDAEDAIKEELESLA